MANRNLKDFSDYVGKEFGYLLVTKVLPRRKDDKGLTVPVEFENCTLNTFAKRRTKIAYAVK